MDKMDPQAILNKIKHDAEGDLMKAKVTSFLFKDTYLNLNEILYVRSYTQIATFAVEDGKSVVDFNEEIDLMGKVFKNIVDIEGCTLIEAANQYLEDMDITFPEFDKLDTILKGGLDFDLMQKTLSKDPFEKWKGTAKDTPSNKAQTQKLMAAVGRMIVQEKLNEDPEFDTYVTDTLLKTKELVAADKWSEYALTRAITKLKEGG